MSDKLELRVFLASPAGLSIERDLVEEVASTLNASISEHLDANISVRRYEQLTAQTGRPQDKINDWVDSCDVLIAIVHRRWGSPAGSDYETGFQEEFERAFGRHRNTGSPLIALYFKDVDASSLKDPGPQLSKVIDFRRDIEKNHRALYQTFESPDQFRSLVFHLLVEQLHTRRKQIDNSRGHIPSRSSAQVEDEVGVDTTASSAPLVSMLRAFASLASGDTSGVEADPDRLLLFALSASRDKELIPVHLANRLASGSEIEDLREIEWRSWIRSYLADIGRSADPSGRVFPLGEIARRPAVGEDIADYAAKVISHDDRNLRLGAARMCLALGRRSDLLWSRKKSDRSAVIANWSGLALDDVGLTVEVWFGLSRGTDRYLLRELRQGDSVAASRTASAILSATTSGGATDEILQLSRDLIVSPWLRTYLGADVDERATSQALGAIATNRYASYEAREAAFKRLACRNDLPQSLVEELIDDTEESTASTPQALAGLELEALRRVPDSVMSAAIDAVVSKRKQAVLFIPDQWRLARIPLAGDIRSRFERLLRHAAVPKEALEFAVNAGNVEYLSSARAWLNDTGQVCTEYADQLRSSGTSEPVISVLVESIQFCAARYMSTLDSGVLHELDFVTISQLCTSVTLGRSAWNRLVEDLSPRPESLIPTLGPYDSDRRRYLASRASTRELKKLLVHDSDVVVDAVLQELYRRGVSPARAVLMRLLRSNTDETRIIAARLLHQESNASQLISARESYASKRYFYNVVSYLDTRMIGVPDVG
jgi:hypothetical protein